MTQIDMPIDVRPNPTFPPGPIIRSAETAPGHRFTLRRAWARGPSILWMGINPSYADAERDDPTILREIGFSYRWGFGSLIKVNWYSFVTPWPHELKKWLAKRPYQKDNVDFVRQEIQRADTCVAAWGNLIVGADLDRMMQTMFDGAMPDWKCIGTTKSGAPTHPLARGLHRVPDSAQMQDWTYRKTGKT